MAAWKTLDHQSLIEFVGQLIKDAAITEQQISRALPSDRPSTCRFKATRGNGEICGQQSVVPYGFCTKHKSSVQGKQAKELFEKQQEEKAKQPEKEPAPPAPAQEKKQATTIRKNAYGNWQHSETGIIFRNHDKKASGIQNSKGDISPLTKETIQYCEKRGWSYVAPKVEEETEEEETEDDEESAEEGEESEEDETEEENDEEEEGEQDEEEDTPEEDD
ncbi:hypothetical protein A9K97_gp220 [Tokyovirus A1]|uniref:hypothetical protein n=1 Tax=Tokyovirus A1 TaxID=1826170 RepID=UPI0007A981F5|nr:hypothetical protein A9K97_gp220 [Tokyovirus A1]BAU80131.1 hypothetical protein [Tokyovirus A1]